MSLPIVERHSFFEEDNVDTKQRNLERINLDKNQFMLTDVTILCTPELLDENIYKQILDKKPKDWDYDFADEVYKNVSDNKIFITNLGKCTQIDARPLTDEVLSSYLKLLEKEIDIVNPKIIISFGNQVSSILLDEKISVSQCRKKSFIKHIGSNEYKVFPVYYPVGNGIFNMDKSIEDIKWIIENYIKG